VSLDTVLQTIVDSISLGSLYAIYALGIGLIFGVVGLINFAHGELVMIGGYSLFLLVDIPWWAGLIATLGVVVVFALAIERTAFRPVRGATPTTLLVTSFALSILLQNVAQMSFSALPKSVNITTSLTESFEVGPVVVSTLAVVTVATTVVLLVGLVLFLKRTTIGVQMRAAAENFPMARLVGVRANRVIAVAFAMSGLLAGIASFLLVAQTGSVSTTMGVNVVVVAFVATILGGIGSLAGSVLGGFILGALTIVLQATLPYDVLPFRDALVYALVLAMLILRPRGLVVTRARTARV
jgi:branched-chain amino acid transport system permease protein